MNEKPQVEQLKFNWKGKNKRGAPIKFHDEYHRVQRELMRRSRAKKRHEKK